MNKLGEKTKIYGPHIKNVGSKMDISRDIEGMSLLFVLKTTAIRVFSNIWGNAIFELEDKFSHKNMIKK